MGNCKYRNKHENATKEVNQLNRFEIKIDDTKKKDNQTNHLGKGNYWISLYVIIS